MLTNHREIFHWYLLNDELIKIDMKVNPSARDPVQPPEISTW